MSSQEDIFSVALNKALARFIDNNECEYDVSGSGTSATMTLKARISPEILSLARRWGVSTKSRTEYHITLDITTDHSLLEIMDDAAINGTSLYQEWLEHRLARLSSALRSKDKQLDAQEKRHLKDIEDMEKDMLDAEDEISHFEERYDTLYQAVSAEIVKVDPEFVKINNSEPIEEALARVMASLRQESS